MDAFGPSGDVDDGPGSDQEDEHEDRGEQRPRHPAMELGKEPVRDEGFVGANGLVGTVLVERPSCEGADAELSMFAAGRFALA